MVVEDSCDLCKLSCIDECCSVQRYLGSHGNGQKQFAKLNTCNTYFIASIVPVLLSGDPDCFLNSI